MAQRVQVLLVCDLHEDEVEGVETVAFGLDGSSYEIDACEEHAAELRDAMARYVGSARRAGRAPSGSGPRKGTRGPARSGSSSSGGGSDRERIQAMREWGRANGHEVSERGRLSASLVQAYEAAH